MHIQSERGSGEVGGGDPNVATVALVGVFGVIISLAVILALQTLYYQAKDQAVREANPVAPVELSRMRAEQAEAISSYRWEDEQSGVVAIPIERAMELTVMEQADGASSGTDESGGMP